jgi:hypothetical protein
MSDAGNPTPDATEAALQGVIARYENDQSPAVRQFVEKTRQNLDLYRGQLGQPPAPTLTPQERAVQAHDRHASDFLDGLVNGSPGTDRTQPHPGLAASIEAETDRIEKLDPELQKRAVEMTKMQLGFDYETIVAAAKAEAGSEWSDSMLGSIYVLRTLHNIATFKARTAARRAAMAGGVR